MLTVWCVLWGDKYHPGYVYALKEAVEKNLSVEHRFVCITHQILPGIETRSQPVTWHGWWQKLGLFAPGVAYGPSLYFDLDVVITGNLDYLVPFTENKFAAPENWAQSGYGGVQSSVMAWDGTWREPYSRFNYQKDSKRLWGDQEFIWEIVQNEWVRIPKVKSYKYHCRNGLPDETSVIVFHGKPDPHEVTDPWISPYISTLQCHINGSMENGLPKALKNTA